MRYFVVDAFTDTLFKGNPAGVCLVEPSHASLTGGWPSDQLMQSIAAENNLSETAFILVDNVTPIGGDSAVHYELRWFTPELEVDLC
ncbi:MAG: PhzF family phenazine biosynthesis protein, partial [Coriobacteriia bacterium]|nr:PhzF family phenazine biosynthesis protein [Coriobacteriia bacterium]